MPGTTPTQPAVSRAKRSRRTSELLLRAHRTDDARLRAQLLDEVVMLNRVVAEAVANRYRERGVPIEDLRQSAYEGLIKAVQRFDPTIRPDLLTYAVPTIRGEVQRWFRDQSWMVRPPRRIQELQWHLNRSAEKLGAGGRPATDAEIMADIGCSAAELTETLQAFGCFQPPSLDVTVGDGAGATLGDLIAEDCADGDRYAATDARVVLAAVLPTLSERDRKILYLRFFEDLNQKDIGLRLGVTQMQVSRLLERILRTLRTQIAA